MHRDTQRQRAPRQQPHFTLTVRTSAARRSVQIRVRQELIRRAQQRRRQRSVELPEHVMVADGVNPLHFIARSGSWSRLGKQLRECTHKRPRPPDVLVASA
eukprot:7032726-Prymnesium_polylepis.1